MDVLPGEFLAIHPPTRDAQSSLHFVHYLASISTLILLNISRDE
jgi:hypothetical protein